MPCRGAGSAGSGSTASRARSHDYSRLIALKPNDAQAYRRRGEALVRAGNPADALRDLDRAIALGDDERGAAHFARGQAYQALGDIEAALTSYDVALERDPTNDACRIRRFQIHHEAGNLDGCIVDIDALLAQQPDHALLLLTRARFCHAANRREEALVACDRVIALDPGNVAAYQERSELHVGRGDTQAAVADMAKAFDLAPNDPQVRADHGRDLLMFRETEEERAAGIQLIDSSVQLDANNPEAWARAAYHFRQAGRPAQALPYITRAIELAPDNVRVS